MNYLILNGAEPVKISDAKASFLTELVNENYFKSVVKDLKLIKNIAFFESLAPIDAKQKEAFFTLKKVIRFIKK